MSPRCGSAARLRRSVGCSVVGRAAARCSRGSARRASRRRPRPADCRAGRLRSVCVPPRSDCASGRCSAAVKLRELARERGVEMRDVGETRRRLQPIDAHQPLVVVQFRVTRIAEQAQRGRAIRDQLLIVGSCARAVRRTARSASAARRLAAARARDCAVAGSRVRRARHGVRAGSGSASSGRSRSSNNTPIEVRNGAESGAQRETAL